MAAELSVAKKAKLDEATAQAANVITADPGPSSASNPSGGDHNGHSDSETTDVLPSIRDHIFMLGRRWHKYRAGVYPFPNDAAEQEREQIKHIAITTLCGDLLHLCPLTPNPQRILDVCTGTGIWAIEMADMYPSAQVTGVDLSPIQTDWVPPNVDFLVDDVESPWIYREQFDLVFMRHNAVSIRDYPGVVNQAYKHVKPGGWIECQEVHLVADSDDGTLPADWPFSRFFALTTEGLQNLGVDITRATQTRSYLEKAGFTDITERVFKIPIGPWPQNDFLKEVGTFWHAVVFEGLQGIGLGAYLRGLDWSREELEVFLVSVRAALKDRSIHAYHRLHVVYGRKPATAG